MSSTRSSRLTALLTLTLALGIAGCDLWDHGAGLSRSHIVVANRADGTLSVIDTRTDAVETIPMPDDGEPMYVVYTLARNRVFVGDRANDRVVAFNARTLEVDGVVPTGAGVFHMWADPQSKQLWVVGDEDNTLTVVDPKRLEVIATVPVEGGTPHDMIVGPHGEYAYTTVFVGSDEEADQVVQYSTETFEEVSRADVGEDPHLSLAHQHDMLYVPSQGSDAVLVLNRVTLEEITALDVPGAHGAGMTRNGKLFYTTNLPGGGTDGLFAIDTQTNTVLGSTDTPDTVPHNIALTPNGRKLYVTHSGANNTVTVYTASRQHPVPTFARTVTVGNNPFGLAYVP
jgi:YVTN family beta-propeller protein